MAPLTTIRPIPEHLIERAVKAALAEDLGIAGDVTTNATVGSERHAVADITAREQGTISGLAVAHAAFRTLDPDVAFNAHVDDGDRVKKGDGIATVSGSARALLTAERVALNFIGHMSGIATLTRHYVEAVSGTQATIIDTRKTTPGLRTFEKYAVRCGGGGNHRSGLFDAVLIKDNHIIAAGGLEAAIKAVKRNAGHMIKIEVEVDTLDQLRQALKHDIDAVLLDNMTPDMLAKAVTVVQKRILTEASGGITLKTVSAISASGVDLISIGALTHSAPVLDVGFDFLPTQT